MARDWLGGGTFNHPSDDESEGDDDDDDDDGQVSENQKKKGVEEDAEKIKAGGFRNPFRGSKVRIGRGEGEEEERERKEERKGDPSFHQHDFMHDFVLTSRSKPNTESPSLPPLPRLPPATTAP